MRLTSKHAKRIYQLVSQWKDQNQTRTYTISELKIMLGLKNVQGVTCEQYKKASMFKKFVLDVAVCQINQLTELTISYELQKRGRSFETIRFTIERQQVVALAEHPATARLHTARQRLAELEIRDPRLVAQILSDATFTDELFRFSYNLKAGKVKASRNPGGLFLTVIGLR